jgi:HAD superfamily hydrolase (TIGR01549 family)
MAKKKDLICFDMDGTLIDSTPAQVKAFKYAVEKNKLVFPGKKKLIAHFGPGIEQVIKNIYPRISKLRQEQVIKDYLASHEKNCSLMKAFPHVKEALLKLKKKFKLGVVSNSHHEEIMERLECAKIPTKIFDVIVGEDDAVAKPSPKEIFLAEKLTKADAKFMVGDTIYDIKAGKKAGCKTIGVLTGIHTMDQLMKASPDILASSVAILPDILLNK